MLLSCWLRGSNRDKRRTRKIEDSKAERTKKELGDPRSMRRAGTKKSSEMERAGDPVDGLESARLINHA